MFETITNLIALLLIFGVIAFASSVTEKQPVKTPIERTK